MLHITITPVHYNTQPTVCPLPEYCMVEPIEVPKGDLTGDELLELFFTGVVLGVPTKTAYV